MSTTQVLAWAVLLVLSLGLPRLLVVCTGPQCDSQIEFVHASSGCCGHDHDSVEVDDGEVPAEDGGEAIRDGHGDCVDVALEIGMGPLPQRVALDTVSPVCLPPAACFVPRSLPALAAEVRPPPAGPPRTDQRTELLASTLLLL